MGVVEIILIGLALSADAISVTICNILANPHLSRSRQLAMPVLFGVFQGVMPLIGFYAGTFAASLIEKYAGIISLIILGIIGGKMIWDAFHDDGEETQRKDISYKVLLLQAVATSIDAFAVGVTFVAGGTNIWLAAPLIMLCTFLCCLIILLIGKRFGGKLGTRAQIIGGVILILIGVKAMWF